MIEHIWKQTTKGNSRTIRCCNKVIQKHMEPVSRTEHMQRHQSSSKDSRKIGVSTFSVRNLHYTSQLPVRLGLAKMHC